MSDAIEILDSGARVMLAEGIDAVVLAAMVRDRAVSYQVAWWDGRVRREDWLPAREVMTALDAPRARIGFRREDD